MTTKKSKTTKNNCVYYVERNKDQDSNFSQKTKRKTRESLEMKYIIPKIKNSIYGLNNILDVDRKKSVY